MKNNTLLKQFYNKFFKYKPITKYNFIIPEQNKKDIENTPVSPSKDLEPTNFFKNLQENLNYIKFKYNSLINSDIVIRDFVLLAKNKEYNGVLIYIDGMRDLESIYNDVLNYIETYRREKSNKRL